MKYGLISFVQFDGKQNHRLCAGACVPIDCDETDYATNPLWRLKLPCKSYEGSHLYLN